MVKCPRAWFVWEDETTESLKTILSVVQSVRDIID